MAKKIIISPENKKAIAFLEELSRKKQELQRKFEEHLNAKKKSAQAH